MTDHIADIVVSASIIFAAGSWLLGAFGSHVLCWMQREGDGE
jgi:hypothetical protein